jgi:hypothetical protein
MRCGAIIATAALAAVAAPPPPAAQAGCAAAVVVDGRLLFGTMTPRAGALPPPGAEHAAIRPACNDAGPPYAGDEDTTVTTLRGVPPHVAVVADDGMYVAAGTLVALRAHPLHLARYGAPGRPSARPGRRCRPAPAVEGRAAAATDDTVRVRRGSGATFVRVDAATRMGNRPAFEPVTRGQRLSVRASRCGRDLVADEIRFVGATVTPAPYERFSVADATGRSDGWAIALLLGGALAILVAAARWLLGPRP